LKEFNGVVQLLKLFVAYGFALENVLGHDRHIIFFFLDKDLSSIFHCVHFQFLNEILLSLKLEANFFNLHIEFFLLSHKLLVLSLISLEHEIELHDLSLELHLLIWSQRLLDISQIEVTCLSSHTSCTSSLLSFLS